MWLMLFCCREVVDPAGHLPPQSRSSPTPPSPTSRSTLSAPKRLSTIHVTIQIFIWGLILCKFICYYQNRSDVLDNKKWVKISLLSNTVLQDLQMLILMLVWREHVYWEFVHTSKKHVYSIISEVKMQNWKLKKNFDFAIILSLFAVRPFCHIPSLYKK